ncbi:flagellar assembly protein FlgT [Psychromonas sp. CD1]|uniref:flagellar assembly protein FlgT n=1 Tax=Psychromonas sp. CD1 TaxID=1979839 RepID=UPI000B9ABE47|nr:flagellar assembly protein FlgT [Psychromonas sp. CD1]
MFNSMKIFCLLILFSCSAHAIWFEGEGNAPIYKGDVEQARKLAVQDALLSLMYQGGASIRSLQIVQSGVFEAQQLSIRTNGEIHEMHLLAETIKNKKISVTITADIYSLQNCQRDGYAKTLFVGPIQLENREQAQLGGLYNIDEEISKRLFNSFHANTSKIDARYLMTRPLTSNTNSYYNIENKMLNLSRDLAAQFDVQYILFGRIEDMSSYTKSDSILGIETTSINMRNYRIQIYVIDAINKETVFRRSYATDAPWKFDFTRQFDIQSNTFWSSEYGEKINDISQKIIRDVNDALYCEATLASIVATYDNNIVINIGGKNGVRRGDKFQLIRQRYIFHQDGLSQGPLLNREKITFNVISVQSDRAILNTEKASDLANIQIRDIVTPIIKDDF